MPKVLEKWKVLPHGQLTEIDDGLWTVTGQLDMPLAHLQRRMTVVRLSSGGLVIYSAIALDEPQMQQLEAWGQPAFLIIPGDHHRMDAHIWKDRYPALTVIAPVGARTAAEEAVRVDATTADFGDEAISFVTVGGMSGHEAALIVRRPAGTTLIVNDIIGNLPESSGLFLRLTGFAGDEPQVPLPVRLGLKDRDALRDQLLAWADLPRLRRIIVSHGEPIAADAAAQLRAVAEKLTA